MPSAGQYASHCKRGHALTAENRLRVPVNGRGLGGCRQCHVERLRTGRGSTKTGPVSRYKGDEAARLAALAQGLKRCCECEVAKPPADFNRDGRTADGLAVYCRACRAERKRATYVERGELIRTQARAAKFGVTVEHLRRLDAEQCGLCAICRRSCPTRRALAVDHDHRTGKVRGLLCANCNRALGLLQDSPAVALAAMEYLRKWNADAEGEASL